MIFAVLFSLGSRIGKTTRLNNDIFKGDDNETTTSSDDANNKDPHAAEQ